mgnify:CR=1 FL=1
MRMLVQVTAITLRPAASLHRQPYRLAWGCTCKVSVSAEPLLLASLTAPNCWLLQLEGKPPAAPQALCSMSSRAEALEGIMPWNTTETCMEGAVERLVGAMVRVRAVCW